MTSVTNSSGLNYQNGVNPLGRKVRALEADVDMLKKELILLKSGGVSASSASTATTTATASASSSFTMDLEGLKRDMAMIKLAGFGRGERGERGEKGERGDKGDPGPMTYIAMPQMPTASAAVPMPVAASVLSAST